MPPLVVGAWLLQHLVEDGPVWGPSRPFALHGSDEILIAIVPPAVMGAVTAFFRVPVPTVTIFFNIASCVVSSLVVDGEDEHGLFPSRGRLLMD